MTGVEPLSQPNEPSKRGTEAAPDALFGVSESLVECCDGESLCRRLLLPDSIRFFDVPVLERLYSRPYHLVRLRGAFHLVKLIRDHRPQLVRSECSTTARGKTFIDRLMFDLGEGVLVLYDHIELSVYAPTTEAAAKAAAHLKQYRKPETEKPGFKLISISGNSPTTQSVAVQQAAPITDQELSLNYGDGLVAWEKTWLERLRQRPSGLTILYGPPGCGKTSYLRTLMARLLGSFEFYYIPVSAFDTLDSPRFVGFWLEQKIEGAKRRIAVVEDAESLLLPRDEGSRPTVSSLLNVADGFLGEHLKLHVVATTNAPVRELDAALLRPGRLMGIREFRRLTRMEAQRLAEAKQLKLADQPDYSLGEIYCGAVSGSDLNVDRQVGFAP